jgi:nucleoside phosphorylase
LFALIDEYMNKNTVISVLAALKREIGPFLGFMDKVTRKRHSGFTIWEGLFSGVRVRVITTGMATEPPIDMLRDCSLLLSTGFCGALRGTVHTGDLVVSSSVAFGDRDLITRILNPHSSTSSFEGSGVFDINVDDELLSVIREKLSRNGQVVHVGRTVTCARTINKREEKSMLGKYFDALAVDMEDYRRLGITRQLGTKMYCVRAVLDDSEDTIPGSWSGLGPGKLSALLRKITPAQQSIGHMLTAIVPAALKKMEME